MNASALDRRIDLQRSSGSQSGSGAVTDNWANLAERVAAGYKPIRGEERLAAPQWLAKQQVEFLIRWRADLASLNPKDRVIYPAIMPDTSPEDVVTEDRIYDIMEVHEVGRREWLQVKTARRADGGG